MKFARSFERWVGPLPLGAKALGGDPHPFTEELDARALSDDNVLVCRQFNTNAWPVQRIIVAWYGPQGANPSPISTRMFAYDELTGFWFATGDARPVPEGVMVAFDMPALADSPTTSCSSPQPVEAFVFTESDPSLPAGRYTFVIGGDVSNTP